MAHFHFLCTGVPLARLTSGLPSGYGDLVQSRGQLQVQFHAALCQKQQVWRTINPDTVLMYRKRVTRDKPTRCTDTATTVDQTRSHEQQNLCVQSSALA